MDFLELLKSSGGSDSISQLSKAVGLGSGDTSKLVAALAPALMGSLTKNAGSSDGMAGLASALKKGGHERYLKQPELMQSEDTRRDGNKILGHLFGSKDVSRKVAQAAGQDTGIDADLIKKALPLLATLAMGAMSKQQASKKESDLGGLLNLAKKFF